MSTIVHPLIKPTAGSFLGFCGSIADAAAAAAPSLLGFFTFELRNSDEKIGTDLFLKGLGPHYLSEI